MIEILLSYTSAFNKVISLQLKNIQQPNSSLKIDDVTVVK